MKTKFGFFPKILLLLAVAAFAAHSFLPDRPSHEYKVDQNFKAPNTEASAACQVQNPAVEETPGGVVDRPFMKVPVMYSQAGQTPVDSFDVGDPVDPLPKKNGGLWALIKANWAIVVTAVLGLIEVIVRITPTEKDNSLFNFLKYILDRIIPNQRKEGGAH